MKWSAWEPSHYSLFRSMLLISRNMRDRAAAISGSQTLLCATKIAGMIAVGACIKGYRNHSRRGHKIDRSNSRISTDKLTRGSFTSSELYRSES